VSHVAVGETSVGGQWANKGASESDDIGTLSYAEMLSLPGYTYTEYWEKTGREGQCDFERPTRAEVAAYLADYPGVVGISEAVYTGVKVDNICRTVSGFLVRLGSQDIRCKHLVLASGIFTLNIPPPPLLAPLTRLDSPNHPLLVVGSGFSAADIIISNPNRKILHLFRWDPANRPSPLHGCHHTAYPEYSTVYRQMKVAASSSQKNTHARSPLMRRKSNPFFSSRDWTSTYEGLPNAEVLSVSPVFDTDSAVVSIRLESGEVIPRTVGGLKYVVGRRGQLSYLSPELGAEVLGTVPAASPLTYSSSLISSRTLRSKVESSFEVTDNVFVIGSLAGDSLIRHAAGGCVYTAGRIMGYIPSPPSSLSSTLIHSHNSVSQTPTPLSASPLPSIPSSLSDSASTPQLSPLLSPSVSPAIPANGHDNLHLDRRKLVKAIEAAEEENRVWRESGWWGAVGGGRGRA